MTLLKETTNWQIVGISADISLVACGYAHPVVRSGDDYFNYSPSDPSNPSCYAKAEIEEFAQEGRLTLLHSPQPFVENAVVLTVWQPFCEALEERFEDRPDWFALNDIAWATIQPAADVEKQMNAWGEKLLRKLALEVCRAFAETSTWEKVERIADFARYAARDSALRLRIFYLYGYTLLQFGKEWRFKTMFALYVRRDHPEMTWEAFQEKVESEVVRVLMDLAYGEQGTEYNAWDAMGVFCAIQGHYEEATPLFKKALEISHQSYGDQSPEYAARLNNLAGTYMEQERYTEAELLLKQALEVYEYSLPQGHSDIAKSLSNLASLYERQGRYAEAEPLLNLSLQTLQQLLPTGHLDTAQSLENLGVFYAQQKAWTTAEPLLKQALEVRRQALPPEHPHIAQSLGNLGSLYAHQGRYGEARSKFDEALRIYEKALPSNHPDIRGCHENLKKLYVNMAQKQGVKHIN